MTHCEKCNVDVLGSHRYCPLCQGPLTGEAEKCIYPVEARAKDGRLVTIFRLIAVILIGCAIFSAAANMALPNSGYWALYVVSAICCAGLLLFVFLRRRKTPALMVSIEAFLAAVMSVLWDAAFGMRGWSLDYVLPILFSGTAAGITIWAYATKRPVEDLIVSIFIDALLGLGCMILYFCGALGNILPTLGGAAVSLYILTLSVLFKRKELTAELRKEFFF